jgi:hypothetical protein
VSGSYLAVAVNIQDWPRRTQTEEEEEEEEEEERGGLELYNNDWGVVFRI